jgi:hypothetical protein
MNLFEKPAGIQTRWASFENPGAEMGKAGLENKGHKGHAFDRLPAGKQVDLLNFKGTGIINRIWLTISGQTPEMLRSLRIDMYWDNAKNPAVSAPLGDFFGLAHGRRKAFENALFSDPEGRSFNCCIPMPFRTAARITLTNESKLDLIHLFYDVNFLAGVEHTPETRYFHTHWRRESPNALGKDFAILPKISGNGRFLGCNIGVKADAAYGGAWWGEGEVKIWFGDDADATLCGTGAEDYIGTAWGQGVFSNRTQGCLVSNEKKREWAFYRYHIDDPVYFDNGCRVAIQTIGGADKTTVIELQKKGVRLDPVSIDPKHRKSFEKLLEMPQPINLEAPTMPDGWCNFRRQDDWCATAYFYLDKPENGLPAMADVLARTAGMDSDTEFKRADEQV